LVEQLIVDHRVHLATRLRKKLRNRLMEVSDKLLLSKRAIIEIVCTHMPTTHLFAGRRRGNDRADVHVAIGDDYPINEQLDELTLLFKAGMLSSVRHTLTEVLDTGDALGQCVLRLRLGFELSDLLRQRAQALFQVVASPLGLEKRHDRLQVGLE
jgi:hypothetical protein